ncbi:unnamed protein product [Bemisia tabaci]|uniref:Methionine aminopeptidase n=1 Tax=Bemisia tabaci TaxID=7038 RepID=A0A9P0G2P4_BEMTA|nr:PREDICTED: methionine aminopeptidase 1 [Bemisia tabaci]CAH0753147.1 unnamed protein product [Bemisia tabaci]
MAAIKINRSCETPGCDLDAKLQCPTCVQLGIQGSYFCSQDCFKGNWKNHKVLHLLAKGESVKGVVNGYDPWPNYRFTGRLRPYPQTAPRTVPAHIGRPDYATHPRGESHSEQEVKSSTQIKILNDEEIEGMRVACRLGREVLDEAAKAMEVGVTTDTIDKIVHEACVERECYPSPLNYYEFPRSCCTSVNEVICHGIPDLRPLQNGDLCNVDVTVYHRGFHGDLNETFLLGQVSDTARKLTQTTWECLDKAIKIVKPGQKYREIGNVIQKYAQSKGFSVVLSYCGHGIHRLFHCAPSVPHYARNKAVGIMRPGHCFTIEPMISEGTYRDQLWPDKWTAVTCDGLLSAQFEHTMLVTDTGVEVLTKRFSHDGQPYFMDNL